MSREIGFRVWSKKYNKYFELSALVYENGKIVSILVNSGISDDISDIIDLEPEDIVLEQDTGLKDKNGKKIYDGDIFKDEYNGGYEVVKYVNQRAAFCLCWMNQESESGGFYIRDTTEMEIVGTIHENPELLGGEE